MSHVPVLLSEVLGVLSPKDGDRCLDCTFGGGGHTRALLDASDCCVSAIDRDPDAEARAAPLKEEYGDRFDFSICRFSEIADKFAECRRFDVVLFDFGVSSFQVDECDRGFSFSKDAPLDMRMSKSGASAGDVVNSFTEGELADIIWTYGEEHASRKIAAAIVAARKEGTIETTVQLADIVRKSVGFGTTNKKYSKLDAATKTFQALRIFVNDELREISDALAQLPQVLNDGARVAMISFHALEDRVVKNWAAANKPHFSPINKNVIKPSLAEIRKNPRSRSAVLRSFAYNDKGDVAVGGGA